MLHNCNCALGCNKQLEIGIGINSKREFYGTCHLQTGNSRWPCMAESCKILKIKCLLLRVSWPHFVLQNNPTRAVQLVNCVMHKLKCIGFNPGGWWGFATQIF